MIRLGLLIWLLATVYGQGGRMSVPSTGGGECTEFPCLIFEDNFDKLDLDTWQHEITAGGGGNWEFQYYTNNRSNSYVRDGILHIKPTLTEDKYGEGFLRSGTLELWGGSPANLCTGNQWYGCFRQGNDDNYINPIQSARLRSVHSFHFRYGRVEIEAQMPKGDWLWAAIWMLPAREQYGMWPSSGEIDIVESRGNLDLQDEQNATQGHDRASAALHWGPDYSLNRFPITLGNQESDFGDAFHKYALEWNANEIIVSVDGIETMRVDPGANGFWEYGNFENVSNPWVSGDKMAPFDQSFYLLMNVAVGGTTGFFPDAWTNYPHPKPWVNTSPTGPKDFWLAKDKWYPTWVGEDVAMKVNYVRVYKMSADEVEPTKPPVINPTVSDHGVTTHHQSTGVILVVTIIIKLTVLPALIV